MRRHGFSVGHVVKAACVILVLAVSVVLFVAPLWLTLVWATRSTADIFSFPPKLLPGSKLLANIEAANASIGLFRSFTISVLVTVVSVIGGVVLSTLAGYVFAKMRFPGRPALFGMVKATMVVPGQIIIVPLFVIMAKLGWIDTYYGLILPGLVPALGVFFMRASAQQSVPTELLEAARVDGAGELTIFARIAVPMLRPGMAALAILLAAHTWGELFWPMVLLRTQEKYTLPVALMGLIGDIQRQPYDQEMAGALFSIVPLTIVFLILQRYFVRGISLTGLK